MGAGSQGFESCSTKFPGHKPGTGMEVKIRTQTGVHMGLVLLLIINSLLTAWLPLGWKVLNQNIKEEPKEHTFAAAPLGASSYTQYG